MKPSGDIKRLLEIMTALRDRKTGCPWDIKQDFSSIRAYTIEEAYEVCDAIERKDYEDLCDELGDLLLQVVFHAQMAQEAKLFAFEDVVQSITEKMIRRHPHIFAVNDAKTSQSTDKEVKKQWEEIKISEKKQRLKRRHEKGLDDDFQESLLQEVSRLMPANEEALKIQKKASKAGFDWNNPTLVLDKIEEEITELRIEISNGNQEKTSQEFGDMMFALVNLGRHLDVNPEMALRDTNHKFRKRFSYIEKALKINSKDIENASLEEMEALWQDTKTISDEQDQS